MFRIEADGRIVERKRSRKSSEAENQVSNMAEAGSPSPARAPAAATAAAASIGTAAGNAEDDIAVMNSTENAGPTTLSRAQFLEKVQTMTLEELKTEMEKMVYQPGGDENIDEEVFMMIQLGITRKVTDLRDQLLNPRSTESTTQQEILAQGSTKSTTQQERLISGLLSLINTKAGVMGWVPSTYHDEVVVVVYVPIVSHVFESQKAEKFASEEEVREFFGKGSSSSPYERLEEV